MDGAGGRGEPGLGGMGDQPPPLVYAQVEGNGRQYVRYDPAAAAAAAGHHAAAAQLLNQQYPQHYQQQPQQQYPTGRPQQRHSRSGGRPSVGQYGDSEPAATARATTRRRLPPDPDSISLHSEHSYKSCSSEPETPLVPRAVSDNYKYSGTASLERSAASMKALQQQRYSNALDAVVGTSAATSRSNSTATLATLGGRQAANTSPVPPPTVSPTSGRSVPPQISSGRTNIPQTPSVGRATPTSGRASDPTTPGSGRATGPTTPGSGRPSGPPTPANSRSNR